MDKPGEKAADEAGDKARALAEQERRRQQAIAAAEEAVTQASRAADAARAAEQERVGSVQAIEQHLTDERRLLSLARIETRQAESALHRARQVLGRAPPPVVVAGPAAGRPGHDGEMDNRPVGWEWDQSLYAGAAQYYLAGRMPYPAELREVLAGALGLDGTGRLLDVGCGPGSLTLLLAPLFAAALGIDASTGMIAAARAQAKRMGVCSVSWRRMRAEEITAGLGQFRVVTFAQSFHWVDGPAVARLVRTVLEPDGACVIVHAMTHQGAPGEHPLPLPRPPRAEIDLLISDYLGSVRRAGRGTRAASPPRDAAADSRAAAAGGGFADDVFADAGFSGPAPLVVGGGSVAERDEDEVVASVFSLSYAAPHLFGANRERFEHDLRALLRRTAPDGRFGEERMHITAHVWRPAAISR